MMNRLHFNTELCDGCCHMTAHEYHEHKMEERRYKQLKALEKLSRNPILSKDIRHIISIAIVDTNMSYYWRNAYVELRNKYEGKGE